MEILKTFDCLAILAQGHSTRKERQGSARLVFGLDNLGTIPDSKVAEQRRRTRHSRKISDCNHLKDTVLHWKPAVGLEPTTC